MSSFIVIGFLISMFLECGAIVWNRVPELDGMIFANEIQVLKARRVKCAKFCSERSGCFSFSYESINDQCFMYDEIYDAGTPASSMDLRYYVSSARDKAVARPTYCISDYIYNAGVCFHPNGLDFTWVNARHFCQMDGGDLIVLDTREKQDKITPYLDIAIKYYIGVWYIYAADHFELADGRIADEATYTNWAPSEPDSANSCGGLAADSSGVFQWYSLYCDYNPGFICELTASISN